MNFIQGVTRLASECVIAGVVPGSLTGITDQNLTALKAWYNMAWMDIQSIHPDWQWKRKSASFTTVTGQHIYTFANMGVSNFGYWERNTFRVYPTSVGTRSETFIPYRDYDSWRNVYQFGAYRTTYARPYEMTVTPDKYIGLGPAPDSTGYTVIGDYFSVPTELSGDTDTPDLPSEFHMAIVYLAMQYYGRARLVPEVLARGEVEYKKMLHRIEQRYMPEIVQAGPLA